MAQHITSLNDLYERTRAMGYEPDGTEKIYVVHGTGSDRDRVFELSQLGTYILNSADGFEFTDSISGGGQISTEVTAAGIEVAFSGSSSSMTTTIKYDYISTDTVKAKKIQGLTPSGAQDFKLVVTNGLDVGTQEDNAPLHVNGTTTLNGATTVNGSSTFNDNVIIGAFGSENRKTLHHYGTFYHFGDISQEGKSYFKDDVEVGSTLVNKNLTVFGNQGVTGSHTVSGNQSVSGKQTVTGKSTFNGGAEVNEFLIAPWMNVLTNGSTDLTTLRGPVGSEITVVNNDPSSDKYVNVLKKTDVAYDAYVQLKIKSGHAMKFICYAVYDSVASGASGASAWSVLSNDDYEGT